MNENYRLLSDVAIFSELRTDIATVDSTNYISTENMLPNRGGVCEASTLPDVKKLPKYEPKDILLSNIRLYFKKIWYADKVGGCSNDVLVVKAKENIDPQFLYYVLSDNNFFNYSTVTSKGTKMPRGSKHAIMKYLVPNIDKPTQLKIADILSAYDELIENNNKRIKLLEQMAENLYKEWFVRRRNPAWEYIRLSDFGYSIESGSRPKGGIDASLQDGYPSLGAEAIGRLGEFDFSSTKLVPEDFYKKMKRGIGKDKDILLYKDGAYIGKVTLFMDEFPYKDYSINEHVFLMRSNESLYQYYLYFTLALPQYFTQMQNLNRNAAQPGLTGNDIDTLKLYRPDEDTIRKFNSAIEPMMHNIFSLAKKNQILIKQRDLLLPRLMSGKLEV